MLIGAAAGAVAAPAVPKLFVPAGSTITVDILGPSEIVHVPWIFWHKFDVSAGLDQALTMPTLPGFLMETLGIHFDPQTPYKSLQEFLDNAEGKLTIGEHVMKAGPMCWWGSVFPHQRPLNYLVQVDSRLQFEFGADQSYTPPPIKGTIYAHGLVPTPKHEARRGPTMSDVLSSWGFKG